MEELLYDHVQELFPVYIVRTLSFYLRFYLKNNVLKK